MIRSLPLRSRLQAAALVVLAALVSTPIAGPLAVAQEEAGEDTALREQARAEFVAGRDAYAAERYREAIDAFGRANSILPNPRLLLYIGQAWAGLGDLGQAVRFYEQYALSSIEASAEIGEELDSLRLQALLTCLYTSIAELEDAVTIARGSQPPPRSQTRFDLGTHMRDVAVQIRSEPRGATVYVDEVELGPVGTTPLETRLFTGRHLITVELPWHETQSRILNVTVPGRGESIPSILFEMERSQVPVRVSLDPITANAAFVGSDGVQRSLGMSAWEGELPAGEGTFIVQQGGRSRSIDALIEPSADGSPREFELALDEEATSGTERPRVGRLRIDARVPFADVYVDGRSVGGSPGQVVVETTPGVHGVEIRREGYETWRAEAVVEAGTEVSVESVEALERESRDGSLAAALTTMLGLCALGAGGYLEFVEGDSLGVPLMAGGGALTLGGALWMALAGRGSGSAEGEGLSEPGPLRVLIWATPGRAGAGIAAEF